MRLNQLLDSNPFKERHKKMPAKWQVVTESNSQPFEVTLKKNICPTLCDMVWLSREHCFSNKFLFIYVISFPEEGTMQIRRRLVKLEEHTYIRSKVNKWKTNFCYQENDRCTQTEYLRKITVCLMRSLCTLLSYARLNMLFFRAIFNTENRIVHNPTQNALRHCLGSEIATCLLGTQRAVVV